MSRFIRQLDHVQLAISAGGEDLARSFYVELLGFHEQDKPAPLNARGGCWFHSGSCTIHLGVDPNFVAAKKAHPAFLVAHFDVLEATLLSAGYRFTRDTELSDVERAFTHDPFGNRIEFIAM